MVRAATRFLAVLCLMLLPSLAAAAHFPDPVPTPTFATMSGDPTVNGAPVAPGDELAVWSVHLKPGTTNRWEKTLVGHSLADGGGSLSSFPVYGDDPSTPDTVEGARGGEEIALVLWRASEGKAYSAYVNRATGAATRIPWQSGGSIDLSALDFREGQRIPLRNGQWNLVSYGVLSGFHTGSTPANAQLKKADGSPAVDWTALAAIGDAFPLRSIEGRYDAVYAASADGSRLYLPSSPSTATLTYIAPGYGLNIKMKADNTAALSWMTVLGTPAGGGESLDLQPGWTLAGYWDNQLYVEDGTDASGVLVPVETADNVALASFGDLWSQGIGASYAQVTSFDAFDPNGVTIWDPANADFSTLRYAAPGYGYWINMYAAGTLRYPFSSAPMGVAAVAGDGAVTVSWKAVPGAQSYRIYWSNIPGVRKGAGSSIAISGTSHAHAPLTNGVPYYYVVTAVRAGDVESNESSEVSATPTATFPAPAVAAMAPADGYEGDLVFIDGSGFLPGDTTVSFGAVAATAASVTESQVIAIVPAGAASGPISIATPGGIAATAPFTVKALPGIASVAPLRGAAGAVVTATGTGFEAGAIVEFNGVPSSQVTVLDGTRIQAAVPDGATDGPLTIVSGGIIMTSADLFRVVAVTGVSPVTGPVGSALAVTGANFDPAARLYFANGVAADNVVVTGTGRIDARVPPGAASGLLRVETAGLSGVVLSPVAFTVIPPPAVAAISPASGPAGSVVTLSGINFAGLSDVRFGGVSAAVTSATATQVTAVVPAVAPGPLTVTVTAAGGSAGIGFTVVAPPTIAGFTPASGAPGTLVTVTGANFDNGAQLFIGAAQASIVSATAGQIVGRVPAGAVTGPVRVRIAGFEATGPADFVVKLPPVVTGFAPATGVVGGTVAVTGANFDNAAVVRFNGRAAVTTFVSDTQLSAVVPTGATDGKLSVGTSAGIGFSADAFGLIGITGFTPTVGAEGTTVTFTGTNFDNSATVRFAGVPAATTFVSPTTLTAVVPAGATTGLPGVVSAAGATPAVTPFRVVSVTGFSPAVAAAGAAVTITGGFFDNTTVVRFADGQPAARTVSSSTQVVATVHDNAVAGPISVTVQSATASSAASFTPALAPRGVTAIPGDGAVRLTWSPVPGATTHRVYWGTTPGVSLANAVGVFNNAVPPLDHGGRVNGTTYYYVVTATSGGVESAFSSEASATPVSSRPPAPTLDAIPLNIDLGKAGDTVHVYGANFIAAGTTVLFNGTAAAGVSLFDNTHLQATVPAGATSGPVTVSTAGGDVQTAAAFRVTAADGFSPASGKAGDLVTVTGTGFVNVTEVRFGGTDGPPADNVSVSGGTQVTFAVPAAAVSGRIWVVQGRTDLKFGTNLPLIVGPPGNFTFLPAPTITSMSISGGVATVDGSNFNAGTTATLNGVTCAVTFVSSTRILVAIPPDATSGNLVIVAQGGTVQGPSPIAIAPTIASLSTLSGPVNIAVTITGSGFDGSSVVRFGGNAAAPSLVVSSTRIDAVVPLEAVTGTVTVTTTAGGTATSADAFTVFPSYYGFVPTQGPAGTTVSIDGYGFDNTTVVAFGDNGVAVTTVISPTRVNAVVPSSGVSGQIRVTTRGGVAAAGSPFLVVPTVAGISPASGAEGTVVTITGANFDNAAQVAFGGGVPAVVASRAYNRITAAVPAGASTGAITVTTAGGSALSAPFTVHQAPVVSGFAPAGGQVGDTVTISGSNFDNASKVYFNGILAAVTGVTATQLQAVVPPSALTGKITVVTTGGSVSSAAAFSVVGAPTVSGFAPASGPVGASVTVNGANFNVPGLAVAFNGVASASVTVVSDNQVVAVVPNAASTGPVTVSTGLGSASSSANFAVSASVASFSPQIGTFGTAVAISGTGFTPFTTVRFNGLPSPRVTFVNPTQLSALVPPGATSGPLTVADNVTTAAAFKVVSALWPTTPSSGVVGTPVAIAGGWFDNSTTVAFDGAAALSVTVVDNTHITAVVPAGARTARIGVTVQGVTAYTAYGFQVVPTIASVVNPRTGNATGNAGDNVVIGGSGFDPSAVVTFNGTPAALLSAGDNVIVAVVPNGATTGRVAVTTPGGSATSAADFGISAVLSGFTPASGPRGTAVTVLGNGFDISSTVSFGGVPATTNFVSATQLTAYVPDGAVTGPVAAASTAGTVVSAGTFFVVPAISSFTPAIGTAGTTLTVSGYNFDNATRVYIGGVEAPVVSVTPLQAVATVPGTVAAGQVTVITAGGASAPSGGLFRYVSITGITPSSGVAGDTVTITGSYFAGSGNTVSFNGVPAQFAVLNNTTLQAVVPAGAATGPVTVTTAGVTVVSTSAFTVQPKRYDAREYFPLRLGDHAQRTDNTVTIMFRKVAVDNLVGVEEVRVPPDRYEESDLFAVDNVTGNVLRLGKLVGNPRTLIAFNPPIVIGTSGMAVGETVRTDYEALNPSTGFPEARWFEIRLDNVVSVATPAGTFDNCLKLDWTEEGYSGSVWLAKGIGFVQQSEQGKGVLSSKYIAAGGQAYGTPYAFNPGADNVSGVYVNDSVIPEGGPGNYGFATERTVNDILHDPPAATYAMTTYWLQGNNGPGSGTVSSGTRVDGNATDPQGVPVSFRVVHTPNAEGYVGQWWYSADNSVKYPLTGVLFHAIEPSPGDEAIYSLNGGSGGIRDNYFSGPLAYAGDDNAWLRDAHFGLRDRGVPVGFQEWFSVRNDELFQLGNSVWPVYVPALKSLPKRFVLNRVYTTYNWLDNTVSRFQVDAVDNVTVPAGNFPLSLRLTQTDTRTGYPDKVRRSWLTPDIRGMVHVKGQEDAKVEELVWYRAGGGSRGAYPANAPTVGLVIPDSGRAGDAVTVTGFNFDNSAQLWFAGTPGPVAAAISSISSNAITATVPPGAESGPVLVIQAPYVSASQSPFTVLPSVPGVSPYADDNNTVLLDHFDGATSGSVQAYVYNGSCGPAYPAATPAYSWIGGAPGLGQALSMSPPALQPANSGTYVVYPGGQLLSQPNGTVEFWINPSSWGGGGMDQGPFYGSCAGWTLGFGISAEGQLQAGAWAAFSMNSGAVTVPTNQWSHVAASWGSGGAKLYLNGQQVGSDANTGYPAPGYGGAVMIRALAPMAVDELRISNVQRTAFNVLPPPSAISVSVAPDNATLPTLGSRTFTAFVSGASDNSVTWSIQEGSPAGGTFFGNGPDSVQYTAPGAPGTYHLVARSNQDNAAQGQATITVVTETDHVTISGHVYRTGTGAPVQGATVHTSLDNASVMTDGSGFFFLQTTTPTGVGDYTIGINAPGYFPYSQLGTWGDHPAGQTFFLDPSSPVGVWVSPDFVTLPAGGNQSFNAFVSGAADNSVSWHIQEGSPDGGSFFVDGFNSVQYTAPTNPGTYHLVAVSNQDNGAQFQATITVTGGTGGGYSLSGNVAYGGSQSGRVYVSAFGNNGGGGAYGTSLDGPGPFTIRGLPPGSYAIRAFIDVADTAVVNANNPSGFLDNVFLSSDLTGLTVNMGDPGPVVPVAPAWVNASPTDAGLLLFWDAPFEDGGGAEIARAYNVFWGTDNTVGPGNNVGSAPGIPARDDAHYFVRGLANGVAYYVAVQAVGADNSTSALRTGGPVVAGAPTGLRTVSGAISFPGVTPTGPLYVIVGNPGDGGADTQNSTARIDSPASPQGYSVAGVPDGVRSLFAFIDMNNDGMVGLGDVRLDNDRPVAVAGADLAGIDAVIPAGNVAARVTTSHDEGGWYGVEPRVREAIKRPVKVVLTGAPAFIPVPVDFGLGDWSEYRIWYGNGVTRPNIGDNYVFSLTYGDNTTETVTASVTGVVDSFPTIVSPVGTITGAGVTVPTFSWTAPAFPPNPYTYHLWISPDNGWDIWNANLPPGQTSVAYNADGGAEQPSLQSGLAYNWGISVEDADGNRGQAYANFTPIDNTPSPVSYTGAVVDSAGLPLGGVLAELVGNPSINAVSVDNGAFVLNGIPSGVSFQMRLSKASFVDTYSQAITIGSSVNRSSSPYVLYTADNVAAWGVTDGKGAIRTRVTQGGTDNVYIGGVTLAAASALHPGTPYPVLYWNGSSFAATGSTNGSGLFLVKGLDDADTVTVTGTKAGWTIQQRIYVAHDNAVMQGKVIAIPDAVVTVQVAPDNATLPTLGSQTFTAFVSGATDNSVTWSIQEGSPAGGTFFGNGPDSVQYTAPGAPGTYHLVARSNQDNAAQGQATITVVTETDHVTMEGHVYNQYNSMPVPGATVSTSLDNAVAVTDANGYFFLQTTYPTPAGSYSVNVDAPGYFPFGSTGNWGDHPTGQSFYLTPSASVGVSVSPNFTTLPAGGIQTFTAFVSGAADNSVSWYIQEGSPGGGSFFVDGPNSVQYTAPTNPGTYHLVAASNQDNSAQGTATITVTGSGSGSYTLSGNVSYSGSKTGRIYLSLGWAGGGNAGYGTSVAGPGPFTIRGVAPGTYVVKAFLDASGTGVLNYADPTGASGTLDVYSDQPGVQVGLADPTPAPAEIPGWINVTPGDGAALLFWDTPFYGDLEAAKSYNVFWGVDSNVGPGNNLGSASVPARDDGHFVVNGLVNGNNYFFGVQAIGSDNSATAVRFFGPVMIGTPPGGYPVSGTVSFPGAAATGPLYVVIGDGSDSTQGTTMRIAKLASPASPQSFTVAGVPDGPHDVFAFLDMNNNGYVDTGDLVPPIDGPYFQLSGAAVDNVNVVLGTDNASARVTTTHGLSGSEWYSVSPRVEPARKQPVLVTLTGAPPAVAVPVDIGLNEWGSFELWRGVPSRPSIGDNYVLGVTYSDNTSETITVSVTRVLDSFPTIVSPVGTLEAAGATTPTFSWTAPASPPAVFQYGLWVQPDMGGSIWDYWGMAPTQSSVAYNVDGEASQAALTSGASYRWGLAVQDEYGNQAQVDATFTPIDTTPPSATDWTGINVDSGPVGSIVVLTGQGFDNSAQLWFAGSAGPVAAPIFEVTPNSITATVPAGAVTGMLSLQVGSWTSDGGPTFTVTTGPIPSVVVVVAPGSKDLQPGQPYAFSATVYNAADGTLAANQGVAWSAREGAAAGTLGTMGNVLNYTATGTPGDYTLVARSTADNNAYGLSFVTVDTNAPAPTAFTVSGTLSYAGTKTGRIYVNLYTAEGWDTGYGVSLGTAGGFAIRGVRPGSYMVRAFMDNTGTGVPNHADPVGGSSSFTVVNANYGGVAVALSDPSAASASAPGWIDVTPGQGSALLFWDTPTDGNELELAKSYNVYWGADSFVGPGSYLGRKTGVKARDDAHYFVGGLADNSVRWFAVTAVGTDNVESAAAVFGPVTIGAPAGGHSVSGTISFPGVTPTGPLAVVIGTDDGAGPDYYTIIPSPTNPQPFTVTGVADGNHDLFAFIDMNNDNTVSFGDIKLTGENPVFQVAGGDVAGIDRQLSGANAEAAVRTTHGTNGAGDWYEVNPIIHSARKLVTRVALISAPDSVQVPIDFGIQGDGRYERWFNDMPRPTIGDRYVFSVRYADNTYDVLTATVTGVNDGFATPLAPVGPVPGETTPVFSWQAPGAMPAGGSYSLYVSGSMGPGVWEMYGLPPSVTSIPYNYDGNAGVSELSSGVPYDWRITVRDADGNQATYSTQFTP